MNKNEINIKPAMKAHEVIGIRSIQVVIIILLISFYTLDLIINV